MQVQTPTRRWAAPVLLLIVFVLECAWFIRTQSLTFDEPVHIAEGLDAWRHHRFQEWNDHPPLARLWCTLPLLNSKYQVDAKSLLGPAGNISDIEPDPQAIAWRARSMNVILGIILALLVWETTRRMFSRGAANLALALFVFSPALIAHFSLATTDGAATLMIFATAAVLFIWSQRLRRPGTPSHRSRASSAPDEPIPVNAPDPRRVFSWFTFIHGIVLGLLLLAKFSTPVMFVVAVGWLLVLASDGIRVNPLRWNWTRTLAVVAIAATVVWAGYFFHVSRLEIRNGELAASFPNRISFSHKVNFKDVDLTAELPAGEYFEGLWSVAQANKMGHAAFFLGQISQRGGFKLYYPTVMLLKWPVIVLAVFLAAIILISTKRIPAPRGFWVLLSFPAIYFLMAIFARFNIGDRHILPVYPFVVVIAGAVWQAARTRPWAKITVYIAVILLAADSLRSAPDYLAYFNIYVPKTESYRLLTDSNLDWGQGLLALKKYEDAHPTETIWLAYFGSVDPAIYGIRARKLLPGEPVSGTVIVSATTLSGQYQKDPSAYRWVLDHPRIQTLDGDLQVFNVAENEISGTSRSGARVSVQTDPH
jgi:hypothetical protein